MHRTVRNAIAIATLAATGAAAHAQTSSLASPLKKHGGKFGWSVSGVPDLSGDGRGDFIVGAEAEPARNNPEAGRVYVYSGVNGQLLRIIIPPTNQIIGTFGWSVCGVPDVTGDGRGDILVGGIWEMDPAGKICGRAYLFNGANGRMVRAWVAPSRQDNAAFGWAMAWVPDTDGDGKVDFLISAPFETVGPRYSAGRVYLISGGTGRVLRIFFSPNFQNDGNFGFDVAGIQDINGLSLIHI